MKRCMIVDDSSVIRKVAKRILSSPQLLVSEASSATEAIYMCEADMPDVIMLDATLPDMDTVDFIRQAMTEAKVRAEDRRAVFVGVEAYEAAGGTMPLKDLGGGQPNLLSLPTVEIVDNWSGIDSTPPIIVQDDEGNDVDVGHHTWVEGTCPVCSPSSGLRPMTISGQYGCGRMMFSTYHTTEDAHSGLIPQELILLYIILEIGVCHDSPPPPPPPVG